MPDADVNLTGLVHLTGAETLTDKTLTAPNITAPVVTTTPDTGWTGTEVLDPGTGTGGEGGDIQQITLTGDVTTLTDNIADGEGIVMEILDGADYEITWPTMTWTSDSATAPTLQTTAATHIMIWKTGTTLYGHAANGA
ncbi:MAG: hypothetical protein GY938_13590 [Ketobacter sp.]|nr:hypothetical protein [Ketobacter sp.]